MALGDRLGASLVGIAFDGDPLVTGGWTMANALYFLKQDSIRSLKILSVVVSTGEGASAHTQIHTSSDKQIIL
jgi:hypothetical protein